MRADGQPADDDIAHARSIQRRDDALRLEPVVGAHAPETLRVNRNAARLASIVSAKRRAGGSARWCAIRAGSFHAVVPPSGLWR